MYFDRYDIVEAHYYWNAEHHSGQWSKEYERMCKISQYFKPGRSVNGPSSENSVEIYQNLCMKNMCEHLFEDCEDQ